MIVAAMVIPDQIDVLSTDPVPGYAIDIVNEIGIGLLNNIKRVVTKTEG